MSKSLPIFDVDLARKLYAQPAIESIAARLPEMGAALDTACCGLAQETTLERADGLLAKIEGARVSVQQIRRRLAEGGNHDR